MTHINYTLSVPQVETILKGLTKLTIEEAGELHNGMKAHAIETIRREKEAEAKAVAAEAAEPEDIGIDPTEKV